MKTKHRPDPTKLPHLLRTGDYSLFGMHDHNRPLHDKPTLEQSMRKHGFMPSSPIQCVTNGNGQLKIVRGHHRFDYAKRLGLPVYYIVDDSNTDIFDLEAVEQQAWSSSDFLISRARAGERDYCALQAFREKHGIPLGAAASLVGGESAGSTNKNALIKSGAFKVGDMTHANQVVAITDLCRELGLAFATSTPFITAVSAALRIPEIDADLLRRRIAAHPKNLHRRSRREDYLEELEALYNYMARGARLPIKIRAHECMLARQKAPGERKRP